jgi:hypothetical protein
MDLIPAVVVSITSVSIGVEVVKSMTRLMQCWRSIWSLGY